MTKAEPANIDALLGRNRAFAAAGGHEGVPVVPRRRVFLVTCLDCHSNSFSGIGHFYLFSFIAAFRLPE